VFDGHASTNYQIGPKFYNHSAIFSQDVLSRRAAALLRVNVKDTNKRDFTVSLMQHQVRQYYLSGAARR
jgi:hypothetical protein